MGKNYANIPKITENYRKLPKITENYRKFVRSPIKYFRSFSWRCY
ncbi:MULTISPECIES: hypothetical protein [Planktothricoides]|nr:MULTISPECIES: hypothetical protein [Planktothricoides]